MAPTPTLIDIGTTATSGELASGMTVSLDLDDVLTYGLLVQANPNGGKSYLLRLLAERLWAKQCPCIIIDPEGEFASLREVGGFVLAGKGGELPASAATAPKLARLAMEHRLSLVCDLFDLEIEERHEWVRLFLRTLLNLPKTLWHDAVVALDEAQQYCPEKADKKSAPARGVIATFAAQARKRGWGFVALVQRLANFSKDAAALLGTSFTGLVTMDVDMDRAMDSLGVRGKERHAFEDVLRYLPAGQMFGQGRALRIGGEPLRRRTLVTVDKATSTHPERGKARQYVLPPAPDQVKEILAQLGDMMAEAPADDDEPAPGGVAVAGLIAERDHLRQEVGQLRAQLETTARAANDADKRAALQLRALDGVTVAEVRRLRTLEELAVAFIKTAPVGRDVRPGMDMFVMGVRPPGALALDGPPPPAWSRIEPLPPVLPRSGLKDGAAAAIVQSVAHARMRSAAGAVPAVPVATPADRARSMGGGDKWTTCERAILGILAWRSRVSLKAVAVWTGYQWDGGGFRNSVSSLSSKGMLQRENDDGDQMLRLVALSGVSPTPMTAKQVVDLWIPTFETRKIGLILAYLFERTGLAVGVAEIMRQPGIEMQWGGGFRNYLSTLRTALLIENVGTATSVTISKLVRAADARFRS
jgi:hypothetical protein